MIYVGGWVCRREIRDESNLLKEKMGQAYGGLQVPFK